MDATGGPRAGWYPDPEDTTRLRWWDGVQWTDHRVARVSQQVQETGPRGVGAFLSASFGAAGRAWKPLTVLALVAVVPMIVVLLAADAQLGFFEWLDEVMEVSQDLEPGEEPVIPAWDVEPTDVALWGVVVFLLYLFAYVVLPLAAVPILHGALTGDLPNLDQAVRSGFRALPRTIGVGLVSTLVTGVCIAVLVLLTALAPPVGVPLILAAIPLVMFLWVRFFALFQPLIVLEGLGLGMFRRSWQLTDGHFWALLGRTVLFGLIVGVTTSVATLPFQSVAAVAPGFAVAASFVVSAAVNTAAGLVQIAAPVVLYQDLTEGPPPPLLPQTWGPPPTSTG